MIEPDGGVFFYNEVWALQESDENDSKNFKHLRLFFLLTLRTKDE